jgi:hypothetical protein
MLLQTVSVAISVLTLTFISVDRWYAICFPLKFKSTTGRAKTAIIIIWLLALAVGEHAQRSKRTEKAQFSFNAGLSTARASEVNSHDGVRCPFYGAQSRDKKELPVFIELSLLIRILIRISIQRQAKPTDGFVVVYGVLSKQIGRDSVHVGHNCFFPCPFNIYNDVRINVHSSKIFVNLLKPELLRHSI